VFEIGEMRSGRSAARPDLPLREAVCHSFEELPCRSKGGDWTSQRSDFDECGKFGSVLDQEHRELDERSISTQRIEGKRAFSSCG
jgi:hypothetical protein